MYTIKSLYIYFYYFYYNYYYYYYFIFVFNRNLNDNKLTKFVKEIANLENLTYLYVYILNLN